MLLKQQSRQKHRRAIGFPNLGPIAERISRRLNVIQHFRPEPGFRKIIVCLMPGFLKVNKRIQDRDKTRIKRLRKERLGGLGDVLVASLATTPLHKAGADLPHLSMIECPADYTPDARRTLG